MISSAYFSLLYDWIPVRASHNLEHFGHAFADQDRALSATLRFLRHVPDHQA